METTEELPGKVRYPGVDLAKVVAMLFVLIRHVVHYGIPSSASQGLMSAHIVIYGLVASCIDLFALCTGFLCIRSNVRRSRLAVLWLQVVFWGIGSLLAAQFIFGAHFPVSAYLKALLPVVNDQYWYFTAYFMLFLFMPLLNRGMLALSRRQATELMIALFVFICLYSLQPTDLFCMRKGYSFPWLMILYLFGAYIRLYGTAIRWRPSWCFGLAFVVASLSSLEALRRLFKGKDPFEGNHDLMSYVSPLTLVVAILLFLAFLNIGFKGERTAKILKTVAATTFGVYLIHVQPIFFRTVWIDRLCNVVTDSLFSYITFIVLFSLVSYCLMSALDYLRIRLFDWLKVRDRLSFLDF